MNKNPISNKWYADPEAFYHNGRYYIYVTQSFTDFKKQLNIDMFTSDDLKNWSCHKNIVDMKNFPWIHSAVWAPTIIEHKNKFYLVFASNDIHTNHEGGGLEIAVSDTPYGPFKSYLKQSLIDCIVNGAQPIDAHLFKDSDGKIFLYYGGWKHCNVAIMNDDMNGFLQFDDGNLFKEITPGGYVEGPCMLKKNDIYYFMWSTGHWEDDSYKVCYGVSSDPTGPFEEKGTILSSQADIGTGPGHNSWLTDNLTGNEYIVYHRHPIGANEPGCRVLCIDKMQVSNSVINKVIMT